MSNMNAFDLTVSALRDKGLNSDQILEKLSKLFQNLSGEDVPEIEEIFSEENAPKPLTDKEKEKEIKEALLKLGVPCHIKGYAYLVRAIVLYSKNHQQKISGELYPTVAKEFKTTGSRVERAIRHAIEVAWERCPEEIVEEVFGNTISPSKGKPTNREFIALLVEQFDW